MPYIGKYRTGLSVILLSIVTCGIYLFYWYYQTMEDINKVSNEFRINSTALIIGSIFCSPIMFVIDYKVDEELARIFEKEGLFYEKKFILWLLLSLFCGIGGLVAICHITRALNTLWAKREEEQRSSSNNRYYN